MQRLLRTMSEGLLVKPLWIGGCFVALLPFSYLLQQYKGEPFFGNALFLVTSVLEGVALWKLRWFLLIPISFGVTLLQFGVSGGGPATHWHWIALQMTTHFTTALLARGLVQHFMKSERTTLDMILALSKSLDSRDPYTASHSEHVAHYAVQLAEALKLSKNAVDAIHIGGLLHDIGKIGVPEQVLNKPSRLNEQEYQIIKQHTTLGYDILKHIPKFKRSGVLEMVLHHHERYDGLGYPYRLKGEDIPLPARIIAVADSFDAMVSKRVYRIVDTTLDYAIGEIRKGKGTQFDPDIADVFIRLVESGQLSSPHAAGPGYGLDIQSKAQACTNY